ncbi:MAG TPA: HAD family phosphatase [Streptosporangiaceae bacterium]|jgi:sugar-phosphatase|nr:HAD family phosphatase [Streptosporangiaceae bacterium]
MTSTQPQSAGQAPFRAVIFDLDGTLVDSESRSHAVWTSVFTSLGLAVDEALIRSFIGRRAEDVCALLAAALPGHDPAALMARAHGEFHAPGRPALGAMPGALDCVQAIASHGTPLGIVTSAGRSYAEATLRTLGIRAAFSVVISADDVSVGKPDPEGFRAAAERLGVAAAACVVFEDAPAGVAAAKAAGMYCVAVATTHVPDDLAGADRIVPDLTAVTWPFHAEQSALRG